MNRQIAFLLIGGALLAGLTGAFAAPMVQPGITQMLGKTAGIVLIDSEDDDDDDDHGDRSHEGDDDDCEWDDDDGGQNSGAQGCAAAVAPNGAPVTPPDNGLFQNGGGASVTIN